jgi:hypothetical protein
MKLKVYPKSRGGLRSLLNWSPAGYRHLIKRPLSPRKQEVSKRPIGQLEGAEELIGKKGLLKKLT